MARQTPKHRVSGSFGKTQKNTHKNKKAHAKTSVILGSGNATPDGTLDACANSHFGLHHPYHSPVAVYFVYVSCTPLLLQSIVWVPHASCPKDSYW